VALGCARSARLSGFRGQRRQRLGWLGTIEFRDGFTPEWQVSVFYDHGSVMLNHYNGFNVVPMSPNHYSLGGIGTGIAYLIPGS
jgi:hypothetical protein